VPDKPRGGTGDVWPGGTLDAKTIFTTPSAKPSRFRSLTMVRAAPPRFEEGEPRGSLKIRLARMFEDRRAESLRPRAPESPPSVPGAQQDPYLYTFLAHDGGRLVGSLGVRLDSPLGLAADDLYRDELEALRDAGARLCELVRLSVDMNSAPKRAIGCLFHSAYLFAGSVCGCEYGVIEARAEHADFYRLSLGFQSIGEARLNRRVGQTETLLCAHLPAALGELARVGGQPDRAAQERTLFPYGFSPLEAVGVVRRLAGLAAAALPGRSRE